MTDISKGGHRPAGTTTSSSGAKTEIERDAEAAMRSADHRFEETKEQAAELGEKARRAARDAADDAKDRARSFAEDRKDEMADRVDGVADALRSAAGSLDDQDQGMFAGYARDAASGLDRMSDALSRQSFDDVVETVEDFARRQPVAFVGGAVLAGFVMARFAKSSAERRRHAAGGRQSLSERDYARHDDRYPPAGISTADPAHHPNVDATIQETR